MNWRGKISRYEKEKYKENKRGRRFRRFLKRRRRDKDVENMKKDDGVERGGNWEGKRRHEEKEYKKRRIE